MVSALPILVVFGAMVATPPLDPGLLSTVSPKITEELLRALASPTVAALPKVASMMAAYSAGPAPLAAVHFLIASALASVPANGFRDLIAKEVAFASYKLVSASIHIGNLELSTSGYKNIHTCHAWIVLGVVFQYDFMIFSFQSKSALIQYCHRKRLMKVLAFRFELEGLVTLCGYRREE
ncbi:hypothetical protein M408DRAFT_11683 [Serendipita vermifera MAFF 305830]|uniref:Uncharacterized protein n=1 Tax=Serendipita vermifera MAFF 305830 TaxID=933852 RepID=A0A0C2W9W1_SERVB|nr:hypothetical protein M408DRAFT_11683 [Serendipita vermifera MAFF 305830]